MTFDNKPLSLNQGYLRRLKIKRTVLSGLLAKLISTGISFAIVSMAVHYLGVEKYGLWVGITSLFAIFGFLDAGVGNALINLVAHDAGTRANELRKIISTAYYLVLALSFFELLIFFAIFPLVDWQDILGISYKSVDQSEFLVILKVTATTFFLGFMLTLVGKIQRGLQEGQLDNLWNSLGAVISFLMVYGTIHLNLGILGFVLAMTLGPLIAYLISNIHFFVIYKKNLYPVFKSVDLNVGKKIFPIGGMFFILQIAMVIQDQVDNLIIANMLGSESVATYSICMKLFLAPSMILSLVFMPMWPAYKNSAASGDLKWIKKSFKKVTYWSLACSLTIALLLIIFGGRVIELWVGGAIAPSIDLMIGCGIWLVFVSIGGSVSSLLNGLECIKPQIIIAISASVVNIAMTVMLIPMFGSAGAIYGTVIAYFICAIIPYFFIIKKLFS